MQKSFFLLFWKPQGWSSHDIVNIMRKICHTKRIGHLGTLDPLASGLLILMVNEATKLNEYLITSKKYYNFNLNLLKATTSGDAEGQTTHIKTYSPLSMKQVKKIVALFQNCSYYQQVPALSAVKIKGKPLYKYHRQNITVKLPHKLVTIHSLSLKNYNPFMQTLNFDTVVSKGTYIRSLGVDLAQCWNQYGYVSELRRTMIENCEQLPILTMAQKNNYKKYLIPVIDFLKSFHYQIYTLQQLNLANSFHKIIFLPNQKKFPPIIIVYDNIKQQLLIYKHTIENEYKYQKLVRLYADHFS